MSSIRKLHAKAWVAALACAALAGGVALAQERPAETAPTTTPNERQAIEDAHELGQAFAAVAEAVSPSVVSVRVDARLPNGGMAAMPFGPFGMTPPQDDGLAHGNGSGLIVRPDGYVLTNYHVVQHAVRIEVHLQDGRRFVAQVVGADPATDLAVIRIPARDLPAATFGDASSVRPGQWAIAIGSPFGLDYTVTTGVVSSVGRGGLGMNEIEDYLQTDASINPGNSGGPLVDLDGRVIGINTMIIGRGSGIGFAVSAELARRVANQIIEHGRVRRAWIGVSFQELTPELAAAFSLRDRSRSGALIADVVPDGPAARAGLRPGDVVVRVDGQPVREGRDLLRAVLRHDVGSRVRLDVVRDRRRRSLVLTTSERPGAEHEDAPVQTSNAPSPNRGPTDGISLSALTAAQRREVGSSGALVTDVSPGSDADRAGIRRGDVILQADGDEVGAPQIVVAALGDGSALLRVRRGENNFYTVLAD